jgi:hypothetical protein
MARGRHGGGRLTLDRAYGTLCITDRSNRLLDGSADGGHCAISNEAHSEVNSWGPSIEAAPESTVNLHRNDPRGVGLSNDAVCTGAPRSDRSADTSGVV